MTVLEVVLSIVALRLAALVLTGLILPGAANATAGSSSDRGDRRNHARHIDRKSAPPPRDDTDELLRDMLLHD